jgi:dynein heavy chain 2
MKETLAKEAVQCVQDGLQFDRFASQVLCLAEVVNFTNQVESAIKSGHLERVHTQLKQKLEQLTSMETKSSKLLYLKVQALVLITLITSP